MGSSEALFVSAYLPASNVPAAGNKLSAAALEAMALRHDVVHAITFANKAERASAYDVRRPANVIEYLHEVRSLDRIVAAFRYPWLPSGAAVRRHLGRKAARRILTRSAVEAIFIDFTQAADVVPAAHAKRASLRVHDVMTQLYRRQSGASGLRGLIARIEILKVRWWERRTLQRVATVYTLSDKDKAWIVENCHAVVPVVIAPQGYYKVTGRSRDTVVRGRILFWANYARPENVDAAVLLIDEIFPAIREVIPHAHLILAGANPPSWASDKRAGVEWTGFVETPDDIFRSSEIGIIPLRYGAGVKIKALEFMAAGIPTVATHVGAEGVPSSHLLHVRSRSEEIVDTCIQLLQSNL